jgi:hypothetical protein
MNPKCNGFERLTQVFLNKDDILQFEKVASQVNIPSDQLKSLEVFIEHTTNSCLNLSTRKNGDVE